MAKKPTKKNDEVEPTVLEEPAPEAEPAEDALDDDYNVWLRGLWMLIFACFLSLGGSLLGVAAVFQFLWMLFAKERNRPVAEFGEDLSRWLARVARFQTAATEEKPFPFDRWGAR
jgi:hypothetical protein